MNAPSFSLSRRCLSVSPGHRGIEKSNLNFRAETAEDAAGRDVQATASRGDRRQPRSQRANRCFALPAELEEGVRSTARRPRARLAGGCPHRGCAGGLSSPPEPPAQIMGETAELTGAVSTDAPRDARGKTAGEGPGDPPGVGDVTLRKLSSSGADGGCRGLAAAQGLRYFGKC